MLLWLTFNFSSRPHLLFMAKKPETASRIADNKKAAYNYFFEERFEAGLVLEGWEVKSLR